MTIPRALLFLPLFAILAGCGIRHYDYNVTPSLTGKPGKTTVAVVGVDDRNRENPGRFKPEYVGLFRDIMVAIPYFIHNNQESHYRRGDSDGQICEKRQQVMSRASLYRSNAYRSSHL